MKVRFAWPSQERAPCAGGSPQSCSLVCPSNAPQRERARSGTRREGGHSERKEEAGRKKENVKQFCVLALSVYTPSSSALHPPTRADSTVSTTTSMVVVKPSLSITAAASVVRVPLHAYGVIPNNAHRPPQATECVSASQQSRRAAEAARAVWQHRHISELSNRPGGTDRDARRPQRRTGAGRARTLPLQRGQTRSGRSGIRDALTWHVNACVQQRQVVRGRESGAGRTCGVVVVSPPAHACSRSREEPKEAARRAGVTGSARGEAVVGERVRGNRAHTRRTPCFLFAVL